MFKRFFLALILFSCPQVFAAKPSDACGPLLWSQVTPDQWRQDLRAHLGINAETFFLSRYAGEPGGHWVYLRPFFNGAPLLLGVYAGGPDFIVSFTDLPFSSRLDAERARPWRFFTQTFLTYAALKAFPALTDVMIPRAELEGTSLLNDRWRVFDLHRWADPARPAQKFQVRGDQRAETMIVVTRDSLRLPESLTQIFDDFIGKNPEPSGAAAPGAWDLGFEPEAALRRIGLDPEKVKIFYRATPRIFNVHLVYDNFGIASLQMQKWARQARWSVHPAVTTPEWQRRGLGTFISLVGGYLHLKINGQLGSSFPQNQHPAERAIWKKLVDAGWATLDAGPGEFIFNEDSLRKPTPLKTYLDRKARPSTGPEVRDLEVKN